MGGSATNEELLTKVIELGAIPPEASAPAHTAHHRVSGNKDWLVAVNGAVQNGHHPRLLTNR